MNAYLPPSLSLYTCPVSSWITLYTKHPVLTCWSKLLLPHGSERRPFETFRIVWSSTAAPNERTAYPHTWIKPTHATSIAMSQLLHVQVSWCFRRYRHSKKRKRKTGKELRHFPRWLKCHTSLAPLTASRRNAKCRLLIRDTWKSL